MDNREYIELVGSYFLSKVTKRIHPTMVINKYSHYGYIRSISPEVKNREFDITPLLHYEKYDETILEFYEILKTKLSHCSIAGFITNLKTLKVKTTSSTGTRTKIIRESGIYCSKNNRITLYSTNIKKNNLDYEGVINHELLHMANSYKK